MAFFDGSIYSEVLGTATSLSVSLPCDVIKKPEGGFPVLYLLHGIFDNHSTWARCTTVDRLAASRGLAVIMPEAPRSFYTDMKNGLDYFSYLTNELPTLCRELFGLSKECAKTFVGGVSMGGYGALKCGLRRPDIFSACAGLSAATDIKRRAADYKNRKDMRNVFGVPAIVDDDDDLFALAKKAAAHKKSEQPKILMCCGASDTRIPENRALYRTFCENGLAADYREAAGGHDWDYWQRILPQVLDFFSEIAYGKKRGC